jgi:hypothetical protein
MPEITLRVLRHHEALDPSAKEQSERQIYYSWIRLIRWQAHQGMVVPRPADFMARP